MPRATTILPERSKVLLFALAGSLLFHALTLAMIDLGVRLSWWSRNALPLWLQPRTAALPAIKVPVLTQKPDDQSPLPMLFVDVNSATATEDAPKDTKYYSSASTRAANPEPKMDSKVPEIAGKQTKMIRLEDIPREKAFPLQPTPRPASEPLTKAEPALRAAPKRGDLTAAKPADSPVMSDDINKRVGEPTEAKPERPRTVQEAKRRLNPSLAGEKMKQEGGVARRGQISMDVRGTPFGRYDEEFIKAVQNRWYDLIDERRFAAGASGIVVVKFHLNHDGRISDARIDSTSVDIIMTHLCQKAIEDPSPYAAWPPDMRRMIGAIYRELTFTFHYE